jgi:hypothetical protein
MTYKKTDVPEYKEHGGLEKKPSEIFENYDTSAFKEAEESCYCKDKGVIELIEEALREAREESELEKKCTDDFTRNS